MQALTLCAWPRFEGMVSIKQPDHRSRVLLLTLGLGHQIRRVLVECHHIRNVGQCEDDFDIDERTGARSRVVW